MRAPDESLAAATFEALRRLVGTWEGGGSGEYPTIDPFEYREVLEVGESPADELIHYRQATWRQHEIGEAVSHVETGFISVSAEGSVEILNAQGGDRVEVLRGELTRHGGAVHLELRSVSLAHDERMVSSWRRFELEGDVLTYTMGMATTAVPAGALHLSARLTRR